MVTGSRELIREMNRRLVLETVINDGPLSRAAISKKLGLTKATISAIVQDLLEEQYIEEIGSDQTQYGRKPILLQFCRQNGYIIALDLGVERTVLIQITYTHIFRPLNLPFVRHHPVGDDLKKCGFSFSIGPYQSDVFPL